MALVSMKEMMIKGKKEGYAIGQFNLNNLEYTQAILLGGTRRTITCHSGCI